MCNKGILQRLALSTVALSALAIFIPCAQAQIIEMREHNGKEIDCVRSGLRSFAEPCGTDGYEAYIFIGSILSVADAPENEKRLVLTPEEVFLGNVPAELMVTTNQGECLADDFQPGDHWLFYIQRQHDTDKLLLAYGSGSAPVADAQERISLLRRLSQMANAGIISGYITQPVWNSEDNADESRSARKHKVLAKRIADGAEYTTLSDASGHFEFQPLPEGTYHVTANTADGLWAEDGDTRVHSHGCSSIGFELHRDGVVSGHIRAADGSPAKHASVEAQVPSSQNRRDWETHSVRSDENGYFEFRGLRPNRYLIGVGISAEDGSPEWKNRVYYPGVRSKDRAMILELGKAEKHNNINFQLLAR
jgi:hypothetical protein